MATITLENVSEQLYKILQQRAAQNNRSVDSEAIACLELVLERKPVDPEVILEDARAFRNKIHGYLTDEDLSLLKKER
jgi:plasmid stability protein